MARNPFKTPGLPKVNDDPWAGKEYSDQNLMASVPLKTSSSLPSDLEVSPKTLATPKSPAIPGITRPERNLNPELRRERFRKLAGILGSKK